MHVFTVVARRRLEQRGEPRGREAHEDPAQQSSRQMVMYKPTEVGKMKEGKSTVKTWLCWLGEGRGRGQDGGEAFPARTAGL